MQFRRGLAAVVVLLTMLGGLPGRAAAGTATERVRDFFASVNRVITDPEDRRPEERLRAVRALVTEMIEFRAASSAALGSEWAARTPAEQDEFVTLFSDLLQTSVFGSVGGRARIDNGLTVSFLGERGDGDATTVATTVLARSANEIAVGYRMVVRAGRWMVQDVIIDGVSLIENYRAQFQKVIQRSSYAGLVGEMRTRLVDLGYGTMLAVPAPAAPAVPTVPAVASAAEPTPPPTAVATRPAHPNGAVATAPRNGPLSTGAAHSNGAASMPGLALANEPARPKGSVITKGPAPVNGSLLVNGTARAIGPARADGPAPTALPPTPLAGGRPADVPDHAAVPVAARPPDLPRTPAPSTNGRPAGNPPPVIGAGSRVHPAYWVQVGAFRTDEAAIKVVSTLREEAVSLLQAPDAPLLRVLVGPFATRQAAASKLREIRARGLDGFVAELAP